MFGYIDGDLLKNFKSLYYISEKNTILYTTDNTIYVCYNVGIINFIKKPEIKMYFIDDKKFIPEKLGCIMRKLQELTNFSGKTFCQRNTEGTKYNKNNCDFFIEVSINEGCGVGTVTFEKGSIFVT
jgi:hypothetical protein